VKATSVLSGLSCRSSFLIELEFKMMVFVEEGKPEYSEKNTRSKARTNNKVIPTVVGGECSHHSYLLVYTYSFAIICINKHRVKNSIVALDACFLSRVACVAGGSGCARVKLFAAKPLIPSQAKPARESRAAKSQLDFSPFFSRPARLFALAFGTKVRAGTHSRRLRRLYRERNWERLL